MRVKSYDQVNSSVLRSCRKTVSDGDDVPCCGRLIQTQASATGKERSPIVDCTVFGTTSAVIAAERSHCRDATSATRWSSLTRYGWAMPCWQRYTSTCDTFRNTQIFEKWSHVVVLPRAVNQSRGGNQHRLHSVQQMSRKPSCVALP